MKKITGLLLVFKRSAFKTNLLICLLVLPIHGLKAQCTVSITGALCPGSTLTAAPTTGIQTLAWSLNGNVVTTSTATWNANGTTVAGGNGYGSGTNQFHDPTGVYVDGSGNVYVADMRNHRIQRWAPGATSGTTVAGGINGGSGSDKLYLPGGVYVDGSGNVYVADSDNNRIQRWAPGATSGTTVAGGNRAGSAANQLNYPMGVYVDVSGNLYVADQGNHRIQRWAPGATSGTTVAGGNEAGSASNQLYSPRGVYVDGSGNVYVADANNKRIQRWTPGATSGTTVAGGTGAGSAANQLNDPRGVYVDGSGNVYVADANNDRIQRWAPGATSGKTVAGGNGYGSAANKLNDPTGVYLDGSGNVYVADLLNHRIQRFAPAIVDTLNNAAVGTYTVTATSFAGCSTTSVGVVVIAPPNPTITGTLCPGSTLTAAPTTGIQTLAWALNGNVVTSTTATWNANGTTVAGGNGAGSGTNQLNEPYGVSVDGSGNVYVAEVVNHRIQRWAPGATTGTTVAAGNGPGSAANQLDTPTGVSVDGSGNVYVADFNNHRIQRWAPGATSGITVVGNNVAGSAANQLDNPLGVYVDGSGNVYVADTDNQRIQRWAPGATSGTTVAGGNGYGSASNQLSGPSGVYVDGSGNVYVADYGNHRIQRWAPGATTGTTVAAGNGPGSASNQLYGPWGVSVDGSGNVYVADYNNHRIQRWAPGATSGTTVAGGMYGRGSAANQLYNPTGVYLDGSGNVYVADPGNNRIQRFALSIVNTLNSAAVGTYTVTAINFAGCSATSAGVVVNALPQGSLTANSVCLGGTGQFTYTSTSGVGPFSLIINGTTYTGIVSGTPFNANPNPAVTTAYTLTSVTDAKGCERTAGFTNATTTITVNPLPQGSVTTNNTILPQGEAGKLTFIATAGVGPFTLIINGVSYPGVVSGTAFNASSNPVATTDYTLSSVTDANGCLRTAGFTKATATITIDPLPQGSLMANTICTGEASKLTFNATNGYGPFTLIINGVSYRGVVSGIAFNVSPSPVATTVYTMSSVTDATNGFVRTASFTKATATITVNPLPQGSLIDIAICEGEAGKLTFTATAGIGPFALIINGESYGVVSGSVFYVTPNTGITTLYTLSSITDANGCVRTSGFTKATATSIVNPKPEGGLTANTICEGEAGKLTFTATAGIGPFALIINGESYPGVVSGTAFNTSANPVASTDYTLSSITDANGCVRTKFIMQMDPDILHIDGFTKETATVTVLPSLVKTITSQPVNATICRAIGATATLSVGSATATATYQWYTQAASATTWTLVANNTNYSGVTTANLNITKTSTTLPATGTKYKVVVTTPCGSVTSNIVSITDLTVLSKAATITVVGTLSPLLTACQGNSVNLSLAAGSIGNIQWQSSTDGISYSNFGTPNVQSALSATNLAIPFNTGALTQTTWFRVVASNGVCATVNGTPIKITVSAPVTAGSISGGNVTVCAPFSSGLDANGNALTTSITNKTVLTLNGATVGATMVWQKSTNYVNTTNAAPVWVSAGSTTNSIIANALTADAWYRVQVTNGACVASSDPVKITVTKSAVAGVVTATTNGIVSASVCSGGDITFTSAAYVGSSIKWEVSTTSATTGFQAVAGADQLVFTMNAVSYAPLSKFYVRAVVTSGNCTIARSVVKTITVIPLSVAGTATGGGTICLGAKGTLALSGYTGTIQWESSTDGTNYVNVPIGLATAATTYASGSATGTASTYLANAIKGATYFRAKVTSGPCAVVYSNVIKYTIATVAASGTITTANATLCSGTGTTMTLTGSIAAVKWFKSTNWTATTPSWTAVTTSTLTSLATGNLTASTAYKVETVTGACSNVSTSNIVTVLVNSAPLAKAITASVTTPTGTSAALSICTGVSKALTIGAGSIGAIQWQKSTTSTTLGFTDIADATSANYTVVSPTVGANYFRAKFTNSCGVSVYGTAIAVYYKDCPQLKTVADLGNTPFSVSVYPNPFSSTFKFATSFEGAVNVRIIDITGKLIEQFDVDARELDSKEIGQEYVPGMYHVTVTQEMNSKNFKIVKSE